MLKSQIQLSQQIGAKLSDQRNSSNAGRFKSTNQRLASRGGFEPRREDFQYFCVNSSLKWRRSRLTAANLQALSPSLVLTVTGQK